MKFQGSKQACSSDLKPSDYYLDFPIAFRTQPCISLESYKDRCPRLQSQSKKFLWPFGPVLAFQKNMKVKPSWNKYIIKFNGLLHYFKNRWICGISSSGVQSWLYHWLLKFIYSEKTNFFCEISTVNLSYVVTVKFTMEILPSQNIWTFNINKFKGKFYMQSWHDFKMHYFELKSSSVLLSKEELVKFIL